MHTGRSATRTAARTGAGNSSQSRSRKSRVNVLTLLFAALVLLLAAYYVGEKISNRSNKTSMSAPVASGNRQDDALASEKSPRARVIKGKKATKMTRLTDASMTPSTDGLVLHINGSIGINFASDLQQHLQQNPSLQRIEITSGGGYATTGFEAARMISKRNLIVKINSYCASMCVAIWAAAAQRQMQPDAMIGLHQWNPRCDVMSSPEREECNYRAQFATEHDVSYQAWLRNAGFSNQLLELQKRTAPEDIAVLNAVQLWEHGVNFSVTTANGTRMRRSDVARYLQDQHRR